MVQFMNQFMWCIHVSQNLEITEWVEESKVKILSIFLGEWYLSRFLLHLFLVMQLDATGRPDESLSVEVLGQLQPSSGENLSGKSVSFSLQKGQLRANVRYQPQHSVDLEVHSFVPMWQFILRPFFYCFLFLLLLIIFLFPNKIIERSEYFFFSNVMLFWLFFYCFLFLLLLIFFLLLNKIIERSEHSKLFSI